MNTDYMVLEAYLRVVAAQEECRLALKALHELKDYQLAKIGVTIYGLTPEEKVKGIRAVRELTGLSLKDAAATWNLGSLLS